MGEAGAQLDALGPLDPCAVGALAQRLARPFGDGHLGAELGRRERDALVLLQPEFRLLRVGRVEPGRVEGTNSAVSGSGAASSTAQIGEVS